MVVVLVGVLGSVDSPINSQIDPFPIFLQCTLHALLRRLGGRECLGILAILRGDKYWSFLILPTWTVSIAYFISPYTPIVLLSFLYENLYIGGGLGGKTLDHTTLYHTFQANFPSHACAVPSFQLLPPPFCIHP